MPGLELVKRRVQIAYMQIYVLTFDEFVSDPVAANAGQVNGLLGAAVPGALFLTTGVHTGVTDFAVERHDREPALDDSWEEIVEASYRPSGERVNLVEWAGEASYPLNLPAVDYRVRYCAIGMDAAHEADVVMEDEPVLDSYLLQFWPALPRADVILKQTSEIAGYWHKAWKGGG